MNAFIRFERHQCWEIDGRRIRFDRELGDELLHFIVEDTLSPFQVVDALGNRKTPDRTWALEAFAEGRLRIVSSNTHLRRARASAETAELGPDEVVELDPKARVRWFVLTGFDRIGQFSTSYAAIHRGLKQLWREQPERASKLGDPPPARTVRRWMVERGSPGDRRWRQMISMQGRVPRRRRLPPLLLKVMDRAAVWYWTSPRFSIRDGYAPSRHDGLAPTIQHEPLAPARLDAETPATRPPRAKGKTGKSRPSKAPTAAPASPLAERSPATARDAYCTDASLAPSHDSEPAPPTITKQDARGEAKPAGAKRWKGFSL